MKAQSKIAVVYGETHRGNASECVLDALEHLGYICRGMRPDEYFTSNVDDYDVFLGQDSGVGIDFRQASSEKLKKTSMFYSDSRFNYVQRDPGDDDMAKLISDNGGWVFQAQTPDIARLRIRFGDSLRVSHLPFAADIHRWTDTPSEEKKYDLAFVGNCYDQGRARAIDYARQFGLYWPGPNAAFNQDASRIYRQSWVVFHASTFWETDHDVLHTRVDYDTTMRFFEAAASGVPIITNPMPDFERCGFVEGFQIFTYRGLQEMGRAFRKAKEAAVSGGQEYSKRLRAFAESNSYEIRVGQALQVLEKNGVI